MYLGLACLFACQFREAQLFLCPGAIILLDIKARFDYTLKDALRQTLPTNLSLRPVCNVRPREGVRFPLAGYMLVESARGDTGL